MLEKVAQQGRKHRGIFEPPRGAGEKCPACRRPFAPLERKIPHNDVDVCSGCAAKFDVATALEKLEELRRMVRDLDYRAGV